METPKGIKTFRIEGVENRVVRDILRQVTNEMGVQHRHYRNDLLKLDGGATGWFDDGANFRITVTNGIITAIGNTVAGGHS